MTQCRLLYKEFCIVVGNESLSGPDWEGEMNYYKSRYDNRKWRAALESRVPIISN